jgi:hypothetical protein
MIRFNCHCTHEFLVPEDQAGGLVQCPKCSRLNDVPLLSDLDNLDQDGTFKMDESGRPPPKNHIADASRAFTREKHDDRGDDIDLRPSVDEFLNVGTTEIPLELADQELPGAPKYDPFTGELIETIDVKPTDKLTPVEAHKIPVAKRAVSYAAVDLHPRVTPATILLALCQPVNLFVMLFVAIAHVIFQAFALLAQVGFFFMVPVAMLIAGLLVSHYGVVVEEIGVTDADELPRPLRDFNIFEDMWNPFIRFCFAILVCFWPAGFYREMMEWGPAGTGFFITCLLFGLYLLPAVLMSSLIAGTYLNLRPDRVIGVIRACGAKYWVSVIGFAIGGAVYLVAMRIVNFGTLGLFAPGLKVTLLGWGIGSPALLLGIYLMHFACWHLGLLYRANHERFPWILQRHVHSKRTDTLAQLEAARRNARRIDALRKNKPDRDQRVGELRDAEKTKRAQTDAKPIWDRVAETRND